MADAWAGLSGRSRRPDRTSTGVFGARKAHLGAKHGPVGRSVTQSSWRAGMDAIQRADDGQQDRRGRSVKGELSIQGNVPLGGMPTRSAWHVGSFRCFWCSVSVLHPNTRAHSNMARTLPANHTAGCSDGIREVTSETSGRRAWRMAAHLALGRQKFCQIMCSNPAMGPSGRLRGWREIPPVSLSSDTEQRWTY